MAYEKIVRADTEKWKGMHQGDKKSKGFKQKKRYKATKEVVNNER